MSADSTPKKKSRKLPILLATVLVLGAAGGGGYWWWTQQQDDEQHPKVQRQAAKPSFSHLDPFTVNLRDERGERFAQIGVTFQIDDPKLDTEIKDHLPAVRNNILLLIASKRIDDLLTPEGKQQLAEEIRHKAGEALGVAPPAARERAAADEAQAEEDEPRRKPRSRERGGRENPIRAVLFSQFIVQ